MYILHCLDLDYFCGNYELMLRSFCIILSDNRKSIGADTNFWLTTYLSPAVVRRTVLEHDKAAKELYIYCSTRACGGVALTEMKD